MVRGILQFLDAADIREERSGSTLTNLSRNYFYTRVVGVCIHILVLHVCSMYTDSMNRLLNFIFNYWQPPTRLLLVLFDLGYRPNEPSLEKLTPHDQKILDDYFAKQDFNDKYHY